MPAKTALTSGSTRIFTCGMRRSAAASFCAMRLAWRGVAQPGAVLQHADPLRAEEAHLRGELAGLLAAVVELPGELPVEEDDGLGGVHAVLGAAEAEHVDARAPGEVGGLEPAARSARAAAALAKRAPSMCTARPCRLATPVSAFSSSTV